MFGFYKKPCEHKKSYPVDLTIVQGLNIINSDMEGEVHREVHFCRSCRVLFLPWSEETIKNIHEVKK
jgi:hypothetical protein